MKQQGAQFGTFDGLDNRRTVHDLFVRFGVGLSDDEANAKRAGFLQALLNVSGSNLASLPIRVTPCTAPEAYHLLVAICGCLRVNIEWATKVLESVVSQDEVRHLAPGEPFLFQRCAGVLARETMRRARE